MKKTFKNILVKKTTLLLSTIMCVVSLASCAKVDVLNNEEASKNDVQVNVGDILEFGEYEQDNDLNNGKEPIEWIVLDKNDNHALVVSEKVIECQTYHESGSYTSWETCSLRKWMNENFFAEAFSKEEQDGIVLSKISNPDNEHYGTEGGNDTEDKVFLLSIDEVEKYFSTTESKQCKATAYAKASNLVLSVAPETSGNAEWYLRTPGTNTRCVSVVDYAGGISNMGRLVYFANSGIRPAMWVSLDSVHTVHSVQPIETEKDDTSDGNSFSNVNVEDVITFGRYESDLDTTNGKEDIEWIVLAKENDRMLVVSKTILDCKPYHTTDTSITWENCSLRKWLNSEFLNSAFSDAEKEKIITLKITNPDNYEHKTEGGNDTVDTIFLLDISQAESYLAETEFLMTYGTDYAEANGLYVWDYWTGRSYWWLRTPGENETKATIVDHAKISDDDETIMVDGYSVGNSNVGVRPAMWIKI